MLYPAGAVPLGAALTKLADAFDVVLSLVDGDTLQVGGRVLTDDAEFRHRLTGPCVMFLARNTEAMDTVSGKGHIVILKIKNAHHQNISLQHSQLIGLIFLKIYTKI